MADGVSGEIGLRLAKVRVPDGHRGSGYAIGSTGILTARSIIDRAVDTDSRCEVIVGVASDRAYDCTVIWDDVVSGMAILEVNPEQRRDWKLRMTHSPSPALAYPWADPSSNAVAVGFSESASSHGESVLTWMLAGQENWSGTLTAGKSRGERAVLQPSEPATDAAGAAVFSTRPHLLLGIVVGHSGGRRRSRFEVSIPPDPGENSDFAAALERVGADPIVHNMAGFVYREYFHGRSLDSTGTPRQVAHVQDPGWFGTSRARTDGGTQSDSGAGNDSGSPSDSGARSNHGGTYFPFVDRPEVYRLTEALTDTLDGKHPRMIVLRGALGAGKSRLVAQVLPTLEDFADYQLLSPLPHHGLRDLPDHLLTVPTVLWVDDIARYQPTTLDQIVVGELLDAHPQLVVIATENVIPARTSAAWSSALPANTDAPIMDSDMMRVVDVSDDPMWIRPDDEPSQVAQVLRAATQRQSSLGAYLAAYDELADYYDLIDDATRALVDVVADWDRSGVGEYIPFETAQNLWRQVVPSYLARGDLHDFMRLSDEKITEKWRAVQSAANETVAGSASLIATTALGFTASEHIRQRAARRALVSPVWDYVLSASYFGPEVRLAIGIRALAMETPQRALRAFESVLFYRDGEPARATNSDDDANGTDRADSANRAGSGDGTDQAASAAIEATARRCIGAYFCVIGRYQQAIASYTDLVDAYRLDDSPHVQDQVAQAFLGIGEAFAEIGSYGQSLSAYSELVDTFRANKHPVIRGRVVAGLLARARTLGRSGDDAEQLAAYRDLIKRYRGDYVTAITDIVDTARKELATLEGQ